MLVYTEGVGGGAQVNHIEGGVSNRTGLTGHGEQGQTKQNSNYRAETEGKLIMEINVFQAGEHLQRPDLAPGGETWTWIIPGLELGKTNFSWYSILLACDSDSSVTAASRALTDGSQ